MLFHSRMCMCMYKILVKSMLRLKLKLKLSKSFIKVRVEWCKVRLFAVTPALWKVHSGQRTQTTNTHKGKQLPNCHPVNLGRAFQTRPNFLARPAGFSNSMWSVDPAFKSNPSRGWSTPTKNSFHSYSWPRHVGPTVPGPISHRN